MNKTTLSENIKKLGLRLFEDNTASELEDIIKEIFPSAEVMSDFVNYKNNLGHITFKINEPYTGEFGKTEIWNEVKIVEEYLRVYDLYIDIQKNDKNKAILKAYISIDYLDNENELKYFNSNIETIYAVNEGNRILNYYIDAVTAQRQENEDYIEQYKDYLTQTIDVIQFSILEEYSGKITHNHVSSKAIKDAKAKAEFINICLEINEETGSAFIETKLCDAYIGNNKVLDIYERRIDIINLEHTLFENIKSEIESINKSLYLKGKKTAKECEALIISLLEKDEHKNEYVKDLLLKARNRYSRLGDIE